MRGGALSARRGLCAARALRVRGVCVACARHVRGVRGVLVACLRRACVVLRAVRLVRGGFAWCVTVRLVRGGFAWFTAVRLVRAGRSSVRRST